MPITLTVTTDLQRIIAEVVEPWTCRDVFMAPSASFVVERVIAAVGQPFRAHGSGSTLVSSALGSYLASQPFRVRLQPAVAKGLDYLRPDPDDQASALATVMLAAKAVPVLTRSNAYFLRQHAGYWLQWPRLHEQTLAKVRKEELRIDSFYLGGVAELLADLPGDVGVIAHTGMWKRHSKAETSLDKLFDWDRPDVADLTKDEAREEVLHRIISREHWLLLSNEERFELEPFLRARVQASNRGVTTYVYASDTGRQRLVTPHQVIRPILAPRLTIGQELSGELAIAEVKREQFDMLRAAYMNANIRPAGAARGAGALYLLVLVGGVIVGGFALSFDPTLCGGWDAHIAGPTVYLLADFAVGPTDYPRLSKLVIMAAVSAEAQLLMERRVSQRWRSLVTTAFSAHPISMKYRGVLDLLMRTAAEGADFPGGSGHKLTYGGALGRWSLAEALATWREKHGARS